MNGKGEVGEICGRLDTAVFFEWKIPDVFRLLKQNYYVYSPDIQFMGSIYYLQLFDDTNKDGSGDWISVAFRCNVNEKVERASFAIDIKKANGAKEDVCHGTLVKGNTCTVNFNSLQMTDLVQRKSELAPLDTLAITCTIWSDCMPSVNDLPPNDSGEKERTRHEDEDGALLRKHFHNLLLEGQDRDVILKVKNKVFRAHKDVLRARSPVFAGMFAHPMKEAESGEVTIEDCDPDAFGQFLEYLYTGKVDTFSLTPRNALGLYYAADKYGFSSLKKTCVEYLKTSLSTKGVCGVIAMAVIHNEEGLRDCAMAFFTNHFHDILETVEWQRFNRREPSMANELMIKAMKSYKKKNELNEEFLPKKKKKLF